MQLTQVFYLHEIGAKKNQEDFLWPLPGSASVKDRIFIVCDGVGGSKKGEVASRIVSEHVGAALLKMSLADLTLATINQLLQQASAKLVQYAKENGLEGDMATTFALLYLAGDRAFISWVGDSRVYHLRGNEVLYRTQDHSLVNSLISRGEITEEEARHHPQKNILLKAISTDNSAPEAEAHWVSDIEEGDYFMLCTDGLLENITEADLSNILRQQEEGATGLLEGFRLCCYDKTKDNYSMYLIRVSTAPAPQTEISQPRTQPETQTPAPTRKRGRRMLWLLLLVPVLVAAAFIMKARYRTRPKPKKTEIITPTILNRDSFEKADSANN
jgi:PPM family protein phosphatase